MIPAKERTGLSTVAGFSLLEVIAALVIASTVAAISIRYLQVPGQSGKQRSCDLSRELLQNYADRYLEINTRPPSRNLRELQTDQYAGPALPICPVTGEAYRLNGGNGVECPTHEATRDK